MGEFDAGLFIWSLITFGVLVGLLARYAFKPLKQALDAREALIRQSLEEAQKARDEARQMAEENRAHQAAASAQSRKVIEDGKRIVSEMKQEAQKQAREEANNIIALAKADITRETQRSLGELKSTVAGLAVRISRQVVRESLDEKRHEELADAFIERLKKSYDAKDQS